MDAKQENFVRTLEEFKKEFLSPNSVISVSTSGSTGKPKIINVEKSRMRASARITCDFLNLKAHDSALLCLPLDYIAGKMLVVRAIERNLDIIPVAPCNKPLHDLNQTPTFAAMVPSQVYASLRDESDKNKLMAINHLIIGGGSIDKDMAEELRSFPNNVWSTYGMTETLSHIALRRLNGKEASEWYEPFPSVSVCINSEGCLVIDAPLVCSSSLTTNDIAQSDANGRFRIIGRRDNVVCSGGIKIQIEEAEDYLRDFLKFNFLLTSVPSAKYGRALVIIIEGQKSQNEVFDIIRESLKRSSKVSAKYWMPKAMIALDKLPTTETGKPARAEAMKIAEALCGEIQD